MKLAKIQQKIYEVRDQKVMLDFDIAPLYGVTTKALNQAVKRNIKRFPKTFVFRLTKKEWDTLLDKGMRSQIVTASQKKRNTSVTPYAFTEHGVTMLASALHSDKAIEMNINIVKAFIAIRQFAMNYKDMVTQIKEIYHILEDHDSRLHELLGALEVLLMEKQQKLDWENRKRIGFRNDASEH